MYQQRHEEGHTPTLKDKMTLTPATSGNSYVSGNSAGGNAGNGNASNGNNMNNNQN